jgi:hypothetical protein
MASHFQTYVANFNRVRMGEMIDFHIERERMAAARASLVVNPLSGRFYDEARNDDEASR